MSNCICKDIMMGSRLMKGVGWDGNCPDHGYESDWYNSEQEKVRRAKSEQVQIYLHAANKGKA